MKKTATNSAQRKLALRSESISVLRPSQLTAAGAGFLPVPPQQPHSLLSNCSQPPFI